MLEKPIKLGCVLKWTHGSMKGTFVCVEGVAAGACCTTEANGPVAVFFRPYALAVQTMALHLVPSWFVHEDGSPIAAEIAPLREPEPWFTPVEVVDREELQRRYPLPEPSEGEKP